MRIPLDSRQPRLRRRRAPWSSRLSAVLWAIAGTVGFIASPGAVRAAEQVIPDYMFPVIKDAGRMSIAVYGNAPELVEELQSEGWELQQSTSLPSGLGYGIWERQLSNGKKERFVVFAGTADLLDGAVDFGQVVTGPIPQLQYIEALAIAKAVVAEADRDSNLTVKFAGHSLGGGLAQYVALELGVPAVVFNAAPIQEDSGIAQHLTFWQQKNRSAQRRLAENNVWNLRLRGDLVSVSPGRQYGRRLTFEPVKRVTGQWVGGYSRHSVQALLDSVLESAKQRAEMAAHHLPSSEIRSPAGKNPPSPGARGNRDGDDDDDDPPPPSPCPDGSPPPCRGYASATVGRQELSRQALPPPPPPCPDGSPPPCRGYASATVGRHSRQALPPPPPPCPDGSPLPCRGYASATVGRQEPSRQALPAPPPPSAKTPPNYPLPPPGGGGVGMPGGGNSSMASITRIPPIPPFPPPPPYVPPRIVMPASPRLDRIPGQNIGGVILSNVASVGNDSAQVDLADGNFSLIVNGETARLDLHVFRKFVTALWAVYFGRQDPGISIDPISMDPQTGGFSEKHLVRYIGRVVNSDLGRVMREADYQMKKWSVGTERADVPGFKSPDDIGGRSGIRYLSLSRFWLVPEDMRFKSADNMLLFDRGRMTVKTEVIGSSGGEKQADPHNERFARFFTEHYDDIARKYPVYQELFDYAKLTALAKYLRGSGIPLYWFLMANKDLILTEDSPGTVDNLAKGSDYWRGLTIQGGVDLATRGQYVYDASAVKAISEAMENAGGRPASTSLSYSKVQTAPAPFSFGSGNEKYSVVPQHSPSAGKDRRGNLYQTDLALRAEGYLVTQGLLDTLRAEMIRQRARRLLAPAVQGMPEAELSARMTSLVSSALAQASQQLEPLLKRLESLKNREFRTEPECSQAWDEVVGGGEAAEWRPFFVQQAHYVSNLELVRYFNPRLQERGEFGTGWRLLIPYRVKPADQTTVKFLNVLIPRQMDVENLISGESERLTFSTDRYTIAGYVPEKLESSQYVGLFLLSDASFRLVDKIGGEFQFDPAGFLTGLALSEDHRIHIEYAGEISDGFEQKPYSIEPADAERIPFLNAQIPKSMIVKDRIHNRTEALRFSAEGEIAGYVPEDASKSSYKILALLSDASFQLMDREDSVVSFTPAGEFERIELPAGKRVPKSISMGVHKVAFDYTTDSSGRVLIANAKLTREAAGAAVTHTVKYDYDAEGRLAQAKRQTVGAPAAHLKKSWRAVPGAALRFAQQPRKTTQPKGD